MKPGRSIVIMLSLFAGLGAVLAAPAWAQAPEMPPEGRLYTGGVIYTGLDEPQTVEAVLTGPDGRVLYAGPLSGAPAEAAEHVDLGGAYMYPGFTDAHAHLQGIGERELTLNLAEVGSVVELVAIISRQVADMAPGQVVYGRGWIETGWPEGRMPAAADLDPVSGANPVILIRADGHALVANTAALIAGGIHEPVPDPPGGHVERLPDGRASGIVIDTAMAALTELLTEPGEADLAERYRVGAAAYVSQGWTGVHNMSVPPGHAPLLKQLDEAGDLPLRLYNAFSSDGMDLASRRLFETDTVTNRAVKLYMDGALGSRGALLIRPYSDRPGSSGLELLSPEVLASLMETALGSGVQLAIHAIGDLANRRILEAYETLSPDADLRWRIEHAQMLHPDDIGRLARSGLIASMQPSHAISDLHFAPARVGPARLRGAYAWASLLREGARIAGGSDAPVEAGSPLIEFYAAVARRDLTGFSAEGWHPEEAVTRSQALHLFTTGPAHAAFQDDDLGTIQPGRLADFTVFDRDIMTIPAEEILQARAVMTVIGGQIVWQAGTD